MEYRLIFYVRYKDPHELDTVLSFSSVNELFPVLRKILSRCQDQGIHNFNALIEWTGGDGDNAALRLDPFMRNQFYGCLGHPEEQTVLQELKNFSKGVGNQ